MERRSGISVDPCRVEPLYQQVFDQIAGRVRNGAFPEGFRLPDTWGAGL